LKRTICCILTALLLLTILPAPVLSCLAEDEVITLYYVSSSLQPFIPLPEGALTSWQIPDFPENAKMLYNDGRYANSLKLSVSKDGLVTLQSWMGFKNNEATESIDVYGGASHAVYHFRILDYGSMVLDQTLDAALSRYAETEFTSDMSDLEKFRKAAEICARDFDYSGSHSGARAMVFFGSGDCWASTDFIIRLCERVGVASYSRPGYKDLGAGSGHKNVIAELDGSLWIAEAGYEGTKPRIWSVYRTGDYSFRTHRQEDGTNAAELYMYEYGVIHPDADGGLWTIPAEWNGYAVVSLSDSFHPSNDGIVRIILPETIRRIGDYAFKSNRDLEHISLSSNLVSIGSYALSYNQKLTGVELPDTLTSIGEYAFYGDSALAQISIPKGVTSIPGYCFSRCGALTVHVTPALTEIDETAFSQTNVTLVGQRYTSAERWANEHGIPFIPEGGELTLPRGLAEIEAEAFAGGAFGGVTIPNGTRSIGSRAFADCRNLKWIVLPASVQAIAEDAFAGCGAVRIAAPAGSAAESFAQSHGLTLVTIE